MKLDRNWTTILLCLALAVLTLAVYWQVLGFGFINLDDPAYVQSNRVILQGLTLHGVSRALVTNYQANWHPLTWISLMLDAQIGGGSPWVFHATNLLLHIANTLLLFLLLQYVTGCRWRSAFVAALFAIHPLHVESVAWVTERKDVLSMLFWLLTMLAYVRYVRQPGVGRYLLIVIAFILGLMSKPMLVSLPIVLLLMDVWPLKRLQSKETGDIQGYSWWYLAREKMPLFVLAAASCVVTIWAQRAGNAVTTVDYIPVGQRLANAVVSCSAYLVKMIYPLRLAVVYPHPGNSLPAWQTVLAAVFLLTMTVLAILRFRKQPVLSVGWFWYLITLLPVIGLVQVGEQGMADRYTYVPLIGIFVAIAWCIPEAMKFCPLCKFAPGTSGLRLKILAVAILLFLSIVCYHQVGYWRDSGTLFKHAIAVTRNNHLAHLGLGSDYLAKGDNADALAEFRQSIRLKDMPTAHYNMAVALGALGRKQEAGDQYAYALKYCPDTPEKHNQYGLMLARMGRVDDAIWHFRRALREQPDSSVTLNNLACAYIQNGDLAKAMQQYEIIVKLNPGSEAARRSLAKARSMLAERKRLSADSSKGSNTN